MAMWWEGEKIRQIHKIIEGRKKTVPRVFKLQETVGS